MRKQDFIKVDSNYNSHLPLLWEALEATKGDVIEMGMGYGSTPFLMEYCKERQRSFFSYESNKEWFDKFAFNESGWHINARSSWCNFKYVGNNWDAVYDHIEHLKMLSDGTRRIDVVFIDHAPGERRKIDIARFANHAQIIVAHDTEPAADHGYQMRAELAKFKYCFEYETDGAWATAVSNFIEVNKWKV